MSLLFSVDKSKFSPICEVLHIPARLIILPQGWHTADGLVLPQVPFTWAISSCSQSYPPAVSLLEFPSSLSLPSNLRHQSPLDNSALDNSNASFKNPAQASLFLPPKGDLDDPFHWLQSSQGISLLPLNPTGLFLYWPLPDIPLT